MRACARYFWFLVIPAGLGAMPAGWLDRVAPLLSPSDRAAYLALPAEARPEFEKHFWDGKAITPDEYFERVGYADSHFGSGKAGSGANTDPGRVYLSLGAPNRITRLPSSRNFFPLEIWYYDASPVLQTTTEVRLLFFLKNGQGLFKLYSPTLNTIRDLLVPQAGLLGMFGPNDVLSEAQIRTTLNSTAIEDEVVSAAVKVATGITATGNDEILARAMSPRLALTRPLHPEVQSRLITSRAKLQFLVSPSPYGGTQVDLAVETRVRRKLRLEVLLGTATVYQNEVRFPFDDVKPIRYLHRLDLLPGTYRVLVSRDDTVAPYSLDLLHPQTGEIALASEAPRSAGRETPFQFGDDHLDPSPDGSFAILPVTETAPVEWIIRRGFQVQWKQTTSAPVVALPIETLLPGSYQLEATTRDATRSVELVVPRPRDPSPTLVSYNANLLPARRLAFLGQQWLLRGNLSEARRLLEASLTRAPNPEAEIALARVDALAGHYDEARDRLRAILGTHPDDFEALTAFAFVEAKLQDYSVARELYQHALAIQDSPTIRVALASLPH